MNAVDIQGVHQRIGGMTILQDVNLSLQEGEVLGLFGHNGAGKTTSMKLILGLLSPSEGRVQVLGGQPQDLNVRRQLGYLPENVTFYPQLTGWETLAHFARLRGAASQQVVELLDQVGLSHAAARRVKTYSKGMRQRLGLAQALLGEPRLLLLDEPTVGLDPIATQELYQLIDRLRQGGTSIILCSHALAGVEAHLNRVAIASTFAGRSLLPLHGASRSGEPEGGTAMNQVWNIARKEFSDGLRNRWLLAISLLFAVLAVGIAWLGAAASGQLGFTSIPATIASLASLATFLMPLIALLLAYDAIVGEEESGTLMLLLTYPLGHGQILMGKFVGHGLILALATLLGFGCAALAIAVLVEDISLSTLVWAFGRFMVSSTLLGWVFLAMAYVLSSKVSEKSRAAGLALGVWFLFVRVGGALPRERIALFYRHAWVLPVVVGRRVAVAGLCRVSSSLGLSRV